MTTNSNGNKALSTSPLAAMAAGTMAIAMGISACQVVSSFSQPSLVRVIDASYLAPALNIYVEKSLFAGNVGEGSVSNYGTTAPSTAAPVSVTAATGGATLASAAVTLKAGARQTIFVTDNGSTPTLYNVSILEDATTAAASGQSEFRFLNQATRTGPVDVYMVAAADTLANTVPICTKIPVGQTCGYVSVASQTLTLVITPVGLTTHKYTSTPLALTGGEVRTVVIVDSQLTSNPPVNVVIADDVN